MNPDPSRASQFSAVRSALVLSGGTLLLMTSCVTESVYGPGGNVFAPGQPRYGYGSPQSNTGRPNANQKTDGRKTPDIKRDPNDTTVNVTPPDSKPDQSDAGGSTTDSGTPSSTEPTGAEKPADSTTPADSKPAVREDLPFGQPVVGKKGYVYSPYAPDKGQVDVQDIPAGTKVKCPYTDKVFRVP